MTFKECIIVDLVKLYVRTFPPISKNGNGIIGKIKRFLLSIPINIVTGGDERLLTETLEKFERKYLLTK